MYQAVLNGGQMDYRNDIFRIYDRFIHMVDIGISSNILKSPSPKCYMTFSDMVIYSDTLNWSNITPIFEPITELDLITNFDLITKFREVSIEHCNGCG